MGVQDTRIGGEIKMSIDNFKTPSYLSQVVHNLRDVKILSAFFSVCDNGTIILKSVRYCQKYKAV